MILYHDKETNKFSTYTPYATVNVDTEEDYNKLIEATEKQKPQKPIFKESQDVMFSVSYTCPRCGGSFTGTGIANYCYHCGQALNWKGLND